MPRIDIKPIMTTHRTIKGELASALTTLSMAWSLLRTPMRFSGILHSPNELEASRMISVDELKPRTRKRRFSFIEDEPLIAFFSAFLYCMFSVFNAFKKRYKTQYKSDYQTQFEAHSKTPNKIQDKTQHCLAFCHGLF